MATTPYWLTTFLLVACAAMISACSSATPASNGTPATAPERPTALAAGPKGGLYIADPVRNQILELLPDDRFSVMAGTGTRGFSGDGGPARKARLDNPGGMAFGPDGTLYFADQGNHRVRAVSAAGVISTIAGDGTVGWVSDGTPGARAPLNPAAVALGPTGRLYVAADTEVLRMEADGTLTRVLGTEGPHQGVFGVGGPATSASADGANGLAFDRAGNLYVAGFNTKTLLMVSPDGNVSFPLGDDGFYPRGPGGLVATPDGAVLAMQPLAVIRVGPTGAQTVSSLDGPGRFHGIRGFSPNGIAVGADGAIYVDTWVGNGYTDTTAIARLSRTGNSSVLLWRHS